MSKSLCSRDPLKQKGSRKWGCGGHFTCKPQLWFCMGASKSLCSFFNCATTHGDNIHFSSLEWRVSVSGDGQQVVSHLSSKDFLVPPVLILSIVRWLNCQNPSWGQAWLGPQAASWVLCARTQVLRESGTGFLRKRLIELLLNVWLEHMPTPLDAGSINSPTLTNPS